MADYSNSRPSVGSIYPVGAQDAQQWLRVEPLLTPANLKTNFLLGIPLVSYFPHPVTGKREELTEEDLKSYISRAVSVVELETGLTLFPVQYKEKHPYDMNFWRSNAHVRVKQRPVTSVENFSFQAANGADLLVINNSWIELGQGHQGQINLIPILPSVATNAVPASMPAASGAGYLSLFVGGPFWVPSVVNVVYTCGYPDGRFPRVINEIVGITAAIDILSSLAATYRSGSYSMSVDGISQSQSTPGPQLFDPRIKQLTEKRAFLIERIKEIYGLKFKIGWL
jgi:hypothetical protein